MKEHLSSGSSQLEILRLARLAPKPFETHALRKKSRVTITSRHIYVPLLFCMNTTEVKYQKIGLVHYMYACKDSIWETMLAFSSCRA